MTTTGELRAIIEELQLIDIGDATSYLGEEISQQALLADSSQEGEQPAGQLDRYSTLSSCAEAVP